MVDQQQADEAGLKAGAIGFVDALVIGLAATSPAYSLAAVIGAIAALAGVFAPGDPASRRSCRWR